MTTFVKEKYSNKICRMFSSWLFTLFADTKPSLRKRWREGFKQRNIIAKWLFYVVSNNHVIENPYGEPTTCECCVLTENILFILSFQILKLTISHKDYSKTFTFLKVKVIQKNFLAVFSSSHNFYFKIVIFR